MTATPNDGSAPTHFQEWFEAICGRVNSVVAGKSDVVENAVITALARGHLLINDVPGVGKTTLAAALARTLGVEIGRIQFTPDLLPSDVVGTSIWNRSDGSFDFRAGPVFTNILLADEINRASPKTQSALLEAMEEGHVTVDGVTRPLPDPFMLIATQNPLEHHGTYPLPDSQLDRFTMSLSIGYPGRAAEDQVLGSDGADGLLSALTPVVDATQLRALAEHCARVHVAEEIRAYLIDVAEATRSHAGLRLGMSTRALVAVQRAARVRAAADGRGHVIPEDVRAVIVPVVAHRLVPVIDHHAAGAESTEIMESIIATTPLRATTG